jgi:hypothetical protein
VVGVNEDVGLEEGDSEGVRVGDLDDDALGVVEGEDVVLEEGDSEGVRVGDLDGGALGVVEGEDVALHAVDNGRLISLASQVFPSVFVSNTAPSSFANDTVAPDNLHNH